MYFLLRKLAFWCEETNVFFRYGHRFMIDVMYFSSLRKDKVPIFHVPPYRVGTTFVFGCLRFHFFTKPPIIESTSSAVSRAEKLMPMSPPNVVSKLMVYCLATAIFTLKVVLTSPPGSQVSFNIKSPSKPTG